MEYATKLIISSILIWIWAFYVNTYMLDEGATYGFIMANLFVASWCCFNTFINITYKKTFFDFVDGMK